MYRWFVVIPADCFMAGTHRFKTRKAAQEFIDEWNRLPENHHGLTYSELPVAQKAWHWEDKFTVLQGEKK